MCSPTRPTAASRSSTPASLNCSRPSRSGAAASWSGTASRATRSCGWPPSLQVDAVFFNHDDDPAALARDAAVEAALRARGIAVHHSKDTVIFERDEVLTAGGTPYSVFTPYKNAWLKKLTPFDLQAYPVDAYADRLAPQSSAIPSLQDMGFAATKLHDRCPPAWRAARSCSRIFSTASTAIRKRAISLRREGPSCLSVHLRFGTVSIRQLAAAAWQQGGRGAQTWLSELIWRDFYHQILWHHPDVASGHAFKRQYDALRVAESTPAISKPGARRAPATRWSTPRCAS